MRKNTGHYWPPNASPYLYTWPLPLQQSRLELLSWKELGDARPLSPYCSDHLWKKTSLVSETLNTGTVVGVQNRTNGFFKVCDPMGVFHRNRDDYREFGAWQMWSDQPWCNHPGRSITEHGRMLTCQAQFGTRSLTNLICVALLIASWESLFIREKKQDREILIQEISLGLILTTSSCSPHNQSIISQPLLLCKAALHSGFWDYKTPRMNVKKTSQS